MTGTNEDSVTGHGLEGELDRVLDGPGRERDVVVIVPARLRAYTERRVLRHLRSHGARPASGRTVGVHSIASFVRSVIGGHDGVSAPPALSPFVLRAFLSREMSRRPDAFRRAGRTFGSVDQFASQIEQLRLAGVTAGDLDALAGGTGPDGGGRFSALRTLMSLVEDRFGVDRYTLPGETGPVMARWLAVHGGDMVFLLYGFERPSASEALAMEAMRRHSDVVWDSRHARHDVASGRGGAAVPVSVPVVPVDVHAVDGPAEEVRFVAHDIARRVRESGGGLSYGDVLVTARDLSAYRALLDTELSWRGVPANTTPAATMLDSRLADVVLGLMDPAFRRREPAAVMRVFRSGLIRGVGIPRTDPDTGRTRLTPLGPGMLDRVENLLAVSDPATIWSDAARADDGPMLALTAIDAFIDRAATAYGPCEGDPVDGSRPTVRDRLSGMVSLLVDAQVNRAWAYGPRGDGDDRRVRLDRQVWDRIMDAFDDMAAVFGGEPFDEFEPTFRDNLASMLRAEPLGVRPKAVDAVDVVAFPTPMRPYRLVYVLGANESQLPAIPHESGLLDDAERSMLADSLQSRGRVASAGNIRSTTLDAKARREPAAFDLVTANATERLIVSWPKASDGVAQHPSPYLVALSVRTDASGPADRDEWAHPLEGRLIDVGAPGNREPLDTRLATLLFTGRADPADPTSPLVFDTSVSAIEQYWSNPYDYFLRRGLGVRPLRPYLLDSALEGVFYHAVLEHAVNRWIRDHPGEQPRLDAMQDLIRDYARLDRSDAHDGPDDGWSVLDEDPRLRVLDSSNRMRAVHRQMTRTLLNMASRWDRVRRSWTGDGSRLAHGDEKGTKTAPAAPKRLVPLHAERQFGAIGGRDGDWAPLEEHTLHGAAGDGSTPIPLRVNGRVDRIDKVTVEDGEDGSPEGILILDYKSSPHTLFTAHRSSDEPDAEAVYHGRELQLLTYARVARERTGLPVAGLFFLPIRTRTGDFTGIGLDARVGQTGPGKPLEHGLAAVLDDGRWESPGTMKLANAGTFVPRWHVSRLQCLTDGSDLDAISDFVQCRIRQAAGLIMQGRLPIAPYRTLDDEHRDGTTYSDYADAIALDLITGEAYRYEERATRARLVDEGRNPNTEDDTRTGAER